MTENSYQFDLPDHHKSIIKVIGVGGGGSNAVNHMYNQGIKDVEFIVCNTDAQALKSSPVPNRLQIGTHLTEGLGAGANPEKGKNAALESKEDIRDLLSENTKMVFITAGMGGGTGTGAAPVISKVARELDILTVGIVTAPFGFEGRKKMKAAELGIRELRENCDTVLVILNDKLREIFGNLSISSAFAQADNVLTTAAKGIAEIITVPGYVNVDFEDVKTVMKEAGAAVMGSSQTDGDGRALRAAEEALASPLLNNKDIHGAQKILLSIMSGEEAELQMDELTEITEYIQDKAGDDAEVIFGHGIDTDLGHSLRVTVIATGFDSDYRSDDQGANAGRKVYDLESNKQISLFEEEKAEKASTSSSAQAEERPRTGSTYTFDSPRASADESGRDARAEAGQESQPEPRNFIELGEEYEIIEESDHSRDDEKVENTQADEDYLEMKRRRLADQARERVQRLKGLSHGMPAKENNTEKFREKLEVPAYLRRNVRLSEPPHSSESQVSRFNLNDDNEILGNNRFLHDNVD
ncbi:cell division protein FtsZ [Roseivirga sp. BDSF3-8]|uniref:cell division protein FtsZ n=1 Tax=Roseivirga sp. BDSF3-8 TaxID=3241598 RepID=UPI003531F5E1